MMAEATNNISPEGIKKLLKLKEILANNKDLSVAQRKTILDEGVRRIRAQENSLGGKIGAIGRKAAGDYDKAVPIMQRGVAQGVENAMTGGFAGQNPPPNAVAQGIASMVVPPDATSAAIEGGMMATGLGAEGSLLSKLPITRTLTTGGRILRQLPKPARLLGEFGVPMFAGREVAPLEGRTPQSGTGQAIAQVAGGKLAAGAINVSGKQGEAKDAARVTKDLGAYIKHTIPHYKGKLETIRDLAYAFIRGKAKRDVGGALYQTERQIGINLGPTVGPPAKLTLPTLHDTLVDLGADPNTTPDEFEFSDAMKRYRRIRDQGYESTGGLREGTNYAAQRKLRMASHQIRDEVVSELNALSPGTGDMLDDIMREDAATHAYTNLIHDLNRAGMSRGKMPVEDLQTLLNTGRDQGFVEDFDRIWGNPQMTDDLIRSAQRGAEPHVATDKPVLNDNMRVYGNPAKPEGLHFGIPMRMLSSILGKHKVGSPTRAFPKIGGTVPSLLMSEPAKFVSEAETGITEGEPVTP